jgi:hypothetical protein
MEIWKEVKGFEDYEISNLGRVKSLARIIITSRSTYSVKERMLNSSDDGNGYMRVSLVKNGKPKDKRIHVLVAEAFLNHTSNGHKLVVDHIDNDRSNNKLGNLQIVTQRKNASKDKKGFSSEYVGVCWAKHNKKWRASIWINGKKKHLGYFIDELEAAKAYQDALAKLVK